MQRSSLHHVQPGMNPIRNIILTTAGLLSAGILVPLAPAHATDFSAFGEDEDICRRAGAEAIKGATGPTAAQRYDAAHAQCMAIHFRMRLMGAYPAPGYPSGNPDNFEYPDAFYGIPYATPGYGYDGFSPR